MGVKRKQKKLFGGESDPTIKGKKKEKSALKERKKGGGGNALMRGDWEKKKKQSPPRSGVGNGSFQKGMMGWGRGKEGKQREKSGGGKAAGKKTGLLAKRPKTKSSISRSKQRFRVEKEKLDKEEKGGKKVNRGGEARRKDAKGRQVCSSTDGENVPALRTVETWPKKKSGSWGRMEGLH